MAQRENSRDTDRLPHEDHEADSENDTSMVHNFIHAVRRPISRPPTTIATASSGASSATTLTTAASSAASATSVDSVSSAEVTSTRPIDSRMSDVEQTSLNVAPSVRHYPQLPLRTAQNRASQQHPHRQGAAIPLPEREDSSRTRVITFGTLKKASMPNRASALSPPSVEKQSRMATLPSYLRHTTFVQHFQPEGTSLTNGPLTSPTDRESSKRRRLLLGDHRRRASTHLLTDSDSSCEESSSGGSSETSSGTNSGSSSGSESGSIAHNHHHHRHHNHNSHSHHPSTSKEGRPLRYLLPSRWSSVEKTDKTELSEDDLQVRYTGPGKADSDASAIRANRPIPPQCGVYYYEILIKSNGQQGYIGIGACNANVALDRLPGWEPLSWGYHGDDGNGFEGCGNGRPFGPVFTTGDVIGCGINFRNMSLFYTKNGIYLGVAFRNLKGPLYPTVGMRTSGEIVEANFGQREFVFNIEEYVKDEKMEAWQSLEDNLQKEAASKNQVGFLSQNLSKLVLSYMIHHGYSESARQFASDLAPQSSNQKGHGTHGSSEFDCASMVQDTERRKEIRKTILSGDIDQALTMLEESYPGITTSNEDMLLQLRCRKFVEMVSSASSPLRALDKQALVKIPKASVSEDVEMQDQHELGRSDNAMMDVDGKSLEINAIVNDGAPQLEGLGLLKDAIHYGQFLQEKYKHNKRSCVKTMLIDAFSVLAYSDADSSSGLGGHLGSKAVSREKVASTVNLAILASQHLPTTAPLETVYRQANVALSELTRQGVGEAAFFDLTHDLE
ncbi:hypothetical protein EC957_010787 [Mortierella hygrophila]|uniref:SPRY-domain-containing protein n=1 Tax=Mortierella hygrophila TaxID=979708 RepID=A0A9P6K891_9FUNG|nr:hypothetical protein EC957_010787 [Mortierella hygrophila]